MTLDALLAGRPARPRPQLEGPQRGEVLRAGAAGLFVTLEAYGPDLELGPVRYARPQVHTHPTHTHPSGTTNSGPNVGEYPPAGTPVLVQALTDDDGSLDLWAVAFDGWPL